MQAASVQALVLSCTTSRPDCATGLPFFCLRCRRVRRARC